MKKFLSMIIMYLFLFWPFNALAEGYINISPTTLKIEQGSTANIAIKAYNSVGDVSIVSNNSNIAKVSTSFWETGAVSDHQTKEGLITITGVSVGTTTIVIKVDGATFDGDDLSGQVKTITVNVVAKQVVQTPKPQPSTNTNNNHNNNINNSNNNVNTNTNNQVNNLSTNNNIKSIKIDGYNLIKLDNNNYKLIVNNSVSEININAIPEDAKSKITGDGKHKLSIGENNIELVITSESGAKNVINIKVIRNENASLSDLEDILKKSDSEKINIVIDNKAKLTNKDISKIKSSKKNVSLSYYDESKKELYTWTIEGAKIEEAKEFNTTVNITEEHVKEIYEMSNYAEGLYLDFKHDGELPKGTKIKIYVGNNFEDNDLVNLYYYNQKESKLELIKNELKVVEGYIEYDIEHCSKYFVTRSNVETTNIKVYNPKNTLTISIILMVVIFVLTIFSFKKNKSK